MSTLKYFIGYLAISLLASCQNREYKLSESDYSWMPYKGNETLVFISNTGDKDTIFILQKDTLIAYPDPQSFNGIAYEAVVTSCRHSDPSLQDGEERHLENRFFSIKKSRDGNARLHFELAAKDAWFYKLGGSRLDSINKLTPGRLRTQDTTYNDIYIIESVDWSNFKLRSNYISRIYWSKSQGLVRYDKQDSVYWELSKKYHL